VTHPDPVKPVNESWSTALVVVAHPDDMEFGASAAVARWSDQGKHVVYCLVTSGEAGIDAMSPDDARRVREEEQRASCHVVGVDTVEFLGLPDGILEYGVGLRREIAGVIRRHQPEIVITNNFRDSWDGAAALNQPDHIATGKATLDAARDAGNRWVFADQISGEVTPWGGVRQVWAASSPLSRHAVDTTEYFDQGVESLRAHQAYIDGLGWQNFDPAEFLEAGARAAGSRLGCAFATAFEVFFLGWGATEE
jgi:LmbE family N-acetylglucosaminyl deacetylase